MEEKCDFLLTEGYHSINGRDVKLAIHPDADPGSSKPQSPSVKVQTVTKFNWPKAYYHGSLISVSTKFIAYVIRGKSDAVRILNRHTASRILLKGYRGPVCDISFAHINSPLLGAIDESGSLFIYHVDQTAKQTSIQYNILLQVQRKDTIPSTYHRIVWSPHIHLSKDGETEEIVSETTYLAATSNNKIDLWKLHSVIPDGTPKVSKVDEDLSPTPNFDGYLSFEAHSQPVTDVSLAPDGMVLCSASLDGLVKFWDTASLVEERKNDPLKILHEWYPHDKQPVSCIKFLDNHLISDSEIPFWRFLLTGASQNRQLKIWCTVKWDCLQTITFEPNPTSSIPYNLPAMKLSTDQSGNYILLTDIHRRAVYCLECYANFEEEQCMIRSANVCLIDTPVLSFHISTVKPITMMSGEDPPRRRRGVQIQSFTLHQSNLYKLQTRILHHDSFLQSVPNSGNGTPSGFLSPTRVLSPGVSGDEQIYPTKLSSDIEGNRQRGRSKTPTKNRKNHTPTRQRSPAVAKMEENSESAEVPKVVQNVEEPSTTNDMSSIIAQLKSERRASNSSCVSSTSTTGAIESTSNVKSEADLLASPSYQMLEQELVTEIPVAFISDNDNSDHQKSGEENRNDLIEGLQPSSSAPNLLQNIFGAAQQQQQPTDQNAQKSGASLLESIFNSASKKGKVSLGDTLMDSTLTNVTSLPNEDQSLPEEQPQNPEEAPSNPVDAMHLLLQNLKKQTADKKSETPETQEKNSVKLLEQRPDAPGEKTPKILVFGDELISDLDHVLDQIKYSIEIHMLEGSQTKNIQKYITEHIGTRKDAEIVIFHVGTNDLAGKRSESQFNTDLMLLFGASRSSFPNAKLCCSSILPRHDEYQSKVGKFNSQAEKQCENCAVEFLNNTKIFSDVENYKYSLDPTECVQLTQSGLGNLGVHFLCYIEDTAPPGDHFSTPQMIIGPTMTTRLPKEGFEIRNLTPVNEDQDEKEENVAPTIPNGPRPLGDGVKSGLKSGRGRDGHGDGSQSPLPPTPTSNATLPIIPNAAPVADKLQSGPIDRNDISTLVALVRRQTEEIDLLRKEVRGQAKIPQLNSRSNQGDFSSQKDFTVKFDRLANEMKQFQRNIANQLNERLSNGNARGGPTDSMVEQILPTVTTRLCEAIERTTSAKLNQSNHMIKEQLEKTLNSVGISMTIGKSVEQSIQMVHRASMESEVIPRFEKATKEMFGQIAQTFSKGTDDYVNRLEKSLERRVKAELTTLEATIAKAEDPAGRLAVNLTSNILKTLQPTIAAEITKQNMKMQQDSTQLMQKMFTMLRSHLVNDMEKLLMNHTSQLDLKVEDAIARAQTPGPPIADENLNLRDQLKEMVRTHKYNEAFTKALMASDLPLVVNLMEMVESDKIFGPDLPGGTTLEQNIILSLIQQMGVDLKTKSSIKFPFLQDAILALDLRHPSEHIPSVLHTLQTKISQFVAEFPRDPMVKNYRMISMTAAGMIKSVQNY